MVQSLSQSKQLEQAKSSAGLSHPSQSVHSSIKTNPDDHLLVRKNSQLAPHIPQGNVTK